MPDIKDLLEFQELFRAHVIAVEAFLNQLYGIMIDPLADGIMSVDEMKKVLLTAALRARERERNMPGPTDIQQIIEKHVVTYTTNPQKLGYSWACSCGASNYGPDVERLLDWEECMKMTRAHWAQAIFSRIKES